MSKPSYDPINKIWKGPKAIPFYNPDQNLGYLILKTLELTPDSVTQISADSGVSVTCQQMYDRSIKIAKYLTKCEMKEGDLIGFVTANTENLAPVVFACFTLGLPINPLSPIMNEKDIVQMFSMTKPKMIFCDAENVKVVQNAVTEMKSEAKILTVMDKVDGYECATDILKEMEDESVNYFDFPIFDSNSTAAVLCSSGSTGFPKGVCKSHKQMITDARPYLSLMHRGVPIYFQGSPIFWLSGFSTLLSGTLFRCIRVVTAKPFDAQGLVDICNQHKDLKPLESVRCVFIGGSSVSDHLCKKFKPFIPNGIIATGYGCTEENGLSSNVMSQNMSCCGTPSSNVQLRIVDDNGNSLGPNQSGEIYSKIPVQFSGYIGNPEETAEAFDGEWFKTGDLGYFDDDGKLYVTGRKKELLKYNNYQVTPSEIEEIINEIKSITDSCVVGVPEPQSGNDIIHAFVIVEELSDLTEDFVLNYVNEKVIDQKRIRGGIHIVESFPLGATGKVDRLKVREMAEKLVA